MAETANFMRDVKMLNRRLLAIESIFQGKLMQYGPITFDAENGRISIYDDTDLLNEIVRFDENGMILKTAVDTETSYIYFYKNTDLAGKMVYRKYTSGSVDVTNMIMRGYETNTSDDRDSYVGWDIYNGSTRKAFMEMIYSVRSTSFDYAGFNFALDGKSPTFQVIIDNASNGNGYMLMPRRSSDPTTGGGRMYYNTSTNKVRICDGGGWKDL